MGRRHSALVVLFAALALGAAANASDTDDKLDEIIVTATLRSVSLEDLPGKIGRASCRERCVP